MDVRHPIHPDHAMALDTEELRAHFHIDKVFDDMDFVDMRDLL